MTAIHSPAPTSPRIDPGPPSVVAAHGPGDMEAVMTLRLRVFDDEQRIVDSRVTDADDARGLHALAYVRVDGVDRPVATGRLTPPRTANSAAVITWVATHPDFRRHGIGSAIVGFLVEAADTAGFAQVSLSAQAHAISFYERFGFVAYGARYTIRGIEHQWMARQRFG